MAHLFQGCCHTRITTVVTFVSQQLSHPYHSYGTTVTTSLEQS